MGKSPTSIVLLIGLVVLLGSQLTGLTCLGEWQAQSSAALVATADHSPAPDGAVADDGCPCHFVFQSVSLPIPEILSPLADGVSSNPSMHAPTFVVSLFRPPLSV